MKRVLNVLPWIFLVSGILFLYIGYRRTQDRSRLETVGVRGTGTVQWATATGRTSNRIRVDYRDANGNSWTKDFTVFSSQYSPGESVRVLYLPSDPQVAMLGSEEAGETRRQDVITLGAGALFSLVGLVWVWALFNSSKP